jgi:hypothetical protein
MYVFLPHSTLGAARQACNEARPESGEFDSYMLSMMMMQGMGGSVPKQKLDLKTAKEQWRKVSGTALEGRRPERNDTGQSCGPVVPSEVVWGEPLCSAPLTPSPFSLC